MYCSRNLEGELPGEFCLYPKLTTLDVQGNHLEGMLLGKRHTIYVLLRVALL
jgi:hypothetical protein